MSLSCSFCQHANPADAKFCNECGAPCHLAPCARCEAINEMHADHCHGCGEPLRAVAAIEPDGPEPAPSSARSSIVRALETNAADVAPTAHRGTRAQGDHWVVLGRPALGVEAWRLRLLRPGLFVVFVACALAPVLLDERPLPPEVPHASLATTLDVPTDIARGLATRQSTPLESLPAQASSRTRGGTIEGLAPETTSQPSERCSDGIAALALCNREEPVDVR